MTTINTKYFVGDIVYYVVHPTADIFQCIIDYIRITPTTAGIEITYRIKRLDITRTIDYVQEWELSDFETSKTSLIYWLNQQSTKVSAMVEPAWPINARTRGRTGDTGATGANGTNGITGLTGTTGATGATGLPGQAGNPGFTGSPGSPGSSGTSGLPGLPGAPGYPGANGGETGVTGPTGTTGINGVNGFTGTTGAYGPTGATGV